jgi:hypothetical protein
MNLLLVMMWLRISRSEIYTRALREYIGHYSPNCVTALMNEVLWDADGQPDAFLVEAGRRALRNGNW